MLINDKFLQISLNPNESEFKKYQQEINNKIFKILTIPYNFILGYLKQNQMTLYQHYNKEEI